VLWAGCVGLVLSSVAFACSPAPAAQAPTADTSDAFAVVRATAQAAYQSGRSHLDRGELAEALIDLDRAKTNDPDNRPEIQSALEEALGRLVALTSTAAAAGASRTPSPAAAPAASPAGPAPATGSPSRVVAATTPSAAPASNAAVGSPAVEAWRDPQGRFSFSPPPGWSAVDQPQTLAGTAVVGFRHPTSPAEVSVAVDQSARAVSPELYAATLELTMQQQVPGYAGEQVLPGTLAGSPSIRRTFSFSQRDPGRGEFVARGFQVVVVRGQTPYIIFAWSPVEQFAQFGPIFDRVVDSFRFS
jgi:hypothetical protein